MHPFPLIAKRSIQLLPLLFLAANPATAQNFFHPDSIRQVEIFFTEQNWDHLLDSMALANDGTGVGQGRLIGTVVIDGMQYNSCGVRYKGNSTYSPTREKNPLNIDLNYVIDGQEHEGVDKIKLSNGWNDPSMIREPLMYEIVDKYMDVSRANYAKVWINGDYKGLYCNTENVGNEFLDAHFGTSDGSFVKCDPEHFVILGANSNLAWYPDSMAYDALYDLKSDFGLAELQDLTYQLNFNEGNIEEYLDVDRALWFHALSNVFVHLDGYISFAHNYYIYKDRNDRWDPILWDFNMSFGGMTFNGLTNGVFNTNEMKQLDPYYMADEQDYRPFIANILGQHRYAKMYDAHVRTIVEEYLDNDLCSDRADHWHVFVDSIVAYEPYSGYTYSEFQNSLVTDVGSAFLLRPGIQSLMQGRKIYLDTLAVLNLPHPEILSVLPSDTAAHGFTTVTINAVVSDAGVVVLGFRNGIFDRFQKIQMYDDGAHDDGAAGDGEYGVDVALGATDLQYYVYAENATGGMFSPVRAEHEFHTVQVTTTMVLNEIQSVNSSTQADEYYQYDDWIELYNNSAASIDLNGYHLSDDLGEPQKWTFPDTAIGPQQYLIVWADDEPEEGSMHATFKVSGDGETVLLSDPNGTHIDVVTVPALLADQSFGRYPNGTGPLTVMEPTFEASNSEPVGIYEVTGHKPSIYPVPSEGIFNIAADGAGQHELMAFSSHGKLVHRSAPSGTHFILDLTQLRPGVYVVVVDGWAARVTKL